MSGTSEEDTTDSGFNSVINRVLNALESARRELASRRNTDNLLTATQTTFRRRRRAGPMAGKFGLTVTQDSKSRICISLKRLLS